MSRFAKLFAANAIAAAGLGAAALAFSPAASADPVIPPVLPDLPALNMIQQFATNPASIGAVLQTASTALNGATQVISPQTLPVSPIAVPGAAPTAPAATPAAPASQLPLGPGSTLVPLLNQLGVPANLANLTPSSMPFPIAIGDKVGVAPAPQAAPVAAPAPSIPFLPVTPGAGVAPLLNALP